MNMTGYQGKLQTFEIMARQTVSHHTEFYPRDWGNVSVSSSDSLMISRLYIKNKISGLYNKLIDWVNGRKHNGYSQFIIPY